MNDFSNIIEADDDSCEAKEAVKWVFGAFQVRVADFVDVKSIFHFYVVWCSCVKDAVGVID